MLIGPSGVQKKMINKSDDQEEAGSPICQSWVLLQTELDNTKSCYQLIITVTISKKKKNFRMNVSARECLKWKIPLFWKFPSFLSFFRISFNCPITGVRLQPTVWLHFPITIEWLMKNKAANAPITFEMSRMHRNLLV